MIQKKLLSIHVESHVYEDDFLQVISTDQPYLSVFSIFIRMNMSTLQTFIVILSCKSIKVTGEMYKLMIGKLFCKNYLEI